MEMEEKKKKKKKKTYQSVKLQRKSTTSYIHLSPPSDRVVKPRYHQNSKKALHFTSTIIYIWMHTLTATSTNPSLPVS